jgi:hypothetical protein
VPSLSGLDSPYRTPGTAVPGYRLFRPCGTASLIAGPSSPKGAYPFAKFFVCRSC